MTLPQTGTYTLTVRGNGVDDFGPYSFQLLEAVSPTATLTPSPISSESPTATATASATATLTPTVTDAHTPTPTETHSPTPSNTLDGDEYSHPHPDSDRLAHGHRDSHRYSDRDAHQRANPILRETLIAHEKMDSAVANVVSGRPS